MLYVVEGFRSVNRNQQHVDRTLVVVVVVAVVDGGKQCGDGCNGDDVALEQQWRKLLISALRSAVVQVRCVLSAAL